MRRTSTDEPNGSSLIQLRTLAGEADAPLPPAEFSRITGISIDNIRSIEAGRRPLSERALKKIKLSMGAMWGSQNARWAFRYEPGVAFDREGFRTFTNSVVMHPYSLDLDA